MMLMINYAEHDDQSAENYVQDIEKFNYAMRISAENYA